MAARDDYIDSDAHTMEWEAQPAPTDAEGFDALPGLARIAARGAWRTTGWAIQNYVSIGRRLAGAAISPQEAARLARDLRRGTESALTDLLNATDAGQRVSHTAAPVAEAARRAVHDAVDAVSPHLPDLSPATEVETAQPAATAKAAPKPAVRSSRNGHAPELTLREQGEQLMRLSRDVHYETNSHPAYARILTELAPDEGRILRLLLLQGPQPSVDVRTGGPLGLFSSRLIAPGISMIGARAGCRYVDRVPSYLNNLFRLGLVWFSRETIRDHMKYQVLEAQPDVLDAIHSVSQAKIVRRSIHLTPFGEDFCRTCLVPDLATSELPAHSPPPEGKATAQPPADPN